MAPIRRAIIIGNNIGYNAPNFLRGVDKDLINYNSYLKSEVGGEWLQPEIKIIHNQGRREILSAIRNCDADYSFVVYSGHGFINSRDGLTYLCVDGGYVSENELSTNLNRQTLILDCCREVSSLSESVGFSGEHFEKGGPVTLSKSRRFVYNARIKFDMALGASTIGDFTGYACLVDQLSGDNPNAGGVYSSALIKSGKKFGSVDQVKNYWLAIRAAHKIATKTIDNDPFTTQNPTYIISPDPMKLTHPFAISNSI